MSIHTVQDALFYFARKNDPYVMNALISVGANPHAKNAYGYNVLEVLLMGNNMNNIDVTEKGIQVLSEHGVTASDITHKDIIPLAIVQYSPFLRNYFRGQFDISKRVRALDERSEWYHDIPMIETFLGAIADDNEKITDKFIMETMEKFVTGLKNRCVVCNVDMGPHNPRQLCGKYYCYNTPNDLPSPYSLKSAY
jgi:ribosomal protein S27AE